MLRIMGKVIFTIEEFPIIGFYLYHVTSAGQSSNWTTSGLKQHILTVVLTSIYRLKFYIKDIKKHGNYKLKSLTRLPVTRIIYGYICTLSTE